MATNKPISKMTVQELVKDLQKRFAAIDAKADSAYRAYVYADNSIKLYRSADKSDEPDEINLPEEMFLDQAKTKLENSFEFTAEAYPGATDPELEGKPVLVMAVKGDSGVSYSFLDMTRLADVSVSAEDGNIIVKKTDGLFAKIPDEVLTSDDVVDYSEEEIAALFAAAAAEANGGGEP